MRRSISELCSVDHLNDPVILGRWLASLLYGVHAADPVALTAAALALLAVGVLAAFVPAYRASRVDPAMVLREQ